jgi:hypothetical protein
LTRVFDSPEKLARTPAASCTGFFRVAGGVGRTQQIVWGHGDAAGSAQDRIATRSRKPRAAKCGRDRTSRALLGCVSLVLWVVVRNVDSWLTLKGPYSTNPARQQSGKTRASQVPRYPSIYYRSSCACCASRDVAFQDVCAIVALACAAKQKSVQPHQQVTHICRSAIDTRLCHQSKLEAILRLVERHEAPLLCWSADADCRAQLLSSATCRALDAPRGRCTMCCLDFEEAPW